MGQLLPLLFALPAGLACQRLPAADRVRVAVWSAYYWLLTPPLVFATFAELRVDNALLLALAAAVIASWLAAGLAYAYARAVGRTRDERGALALGAGCGNTGFLGYPMAQLAFGHPGLALAVVYDRVGWLVPTSAVTVVFARMHGRRTDALALRGRLRAVLVNPPLWAALVALAVRGAGAVPPGMHAVQLAVGSVVGGAGFFLLGFALPLERVAHGADELGRAAGAIAVRFAGGPLTLFLAARLLGASVPPVFYLLSAMPAAFHLLVLARVYDLRPALMRLIVVASTTVAVTAVVAASALAR